MGYKRSHKSYNVHTRVITQYPWRNGANFQASLLTFIILLINSVCKYNSLVRQVLVLGLFLPLQSISECGNNSSILAKPYIYNLNNNCSASELLKKAILGNAPYCPFLTAYRRHGLCLTVSSFTINC